MSFWKRAERESGEEQHGGWFWLENGYVNIKNMNCPLDDDAAAARREGGQAANKDTTTNGRIVVGCGSGGGSRYASPYRPEGVKDGGRGGETLRFGASRRIACSKKKWLRLPRWSTGVILEPTPAIRSHSSGEWHRVVLSFLALFPVDCSTIHIRQKQE